MATKLPSTEPAPLDRGSIVRGTVVPAVVGASGATLTVTDVAPSAAGDSRGLPVFGSTTGTGIVVLAAWIVGAVAAFVIASVVRSRRRGA